MNKRFLKILAKILGAIVVLGDGSLRCDISEIFVESTVAVSF
jgi:hypothetical protein